MGAKGERNSHSLACVWQPLVRITSAGCLLCAEIEQWPAVTICDALRFHIWASAADCCLRHLKAATRNAGLSSAILLTVQSIISNYSQT